MATGTSAALQLQYALHGVGEVLDRKSAYSLALLSLYIAVISLILTLVGIAIALP